MKQKLDILLIEDYEDDALLILREFCRGGFKPSYLCVESEEEMRKASNRSNRKENNNGEDIITRENCACEDECPKEEDLGRGANEEYR